MLWTTRSTECDLLVELLLYMSELLGLIIGTIRKKGAY